MANILKIDEYEKSKEKTHRYRKIKKILLDTFGYSSFRPGQYNAINNAINGNDVCIVFPTGSGKSMCFQMPSIYTGKPTIIISPLISLMDDQKIILSKLGITSCCYNSTVNKVLMQNEILQGKYLFIYITPESIVKSTEFLKQLNDTIGICLFAIDEAHCISSYGFHFRPDYRKLASIRDDFSDVPIMAVTATATGEVCRDIVRTLKMKEELIIKSSFDRPNLYIEINKKTSATKSTVNCKEKIMKDILPVLKAHSNESVIIYCLTRKETESISYALERAGIPCKPYHADISAAEKHKTHVKFLNNEIKIIAATIAFGMGINKPDVRVVIHYGCPKSIEGYYQEIGRAGRDGNPAYCYLFYNGADFKIQESIIRRNVNVAYKPILLELLEKMRCLAMSQKCRRYLLLKYFDEISPEKCTNCDNCIGKKFEQNIPVKNTTEQQVDAEAHLLMDLIEEVSAMGKSFGKTTYAKILKGSVDKSINKTHRELSHYRKGDYKTRQWWIELIEVLVEKKFLQEILVGSLNVPVIKMSSIGLQWHRMSALNGLLETNTAELGPVGMSFKK